MNLSWNPRVRHTSRSLPCIRVALIGVCLLACVSLLRRRVLACIGRDTVDVGIGLGLDERRLLPSRRHPWDCRQVRHISLWRQRRLLGARDARPRAPLACWRTRLPRRPSRPFPYRWLPRGKCPWHWLREAQASLSILYCASAFLIPYVVGVLRYRHHRGVWRRGGHTCIPCVAQPPRPSPAVTNSAIISLDMPFPSVQVRYRKPLKRGGPNALRLHPSRLGMHGSDNSNHSPVTSTLRV
jgi:hypothetical protein